VTIGRIVFGALEKWLPARQVCRILPWLVAASCVATALLSKAHANLGVATFALAGLACSALLPLAISLAQGQLPSMASSVAGGLIAFYQIGYGIAAFGVGPLQSRVGLQLNTIYASTSLVALILAGLALLIVRSPLHQGRQS
jgi:predicted MFS family arabinose efflux permease